MVMGHTRMTTQGSARRNENNHPFRGRAGNTSFALAHNGILYNDRILRKEFKLPGSRIETDSYVAVQLLEQLGRMDFEVLRAMAEELEGSFTITALTERDELYYVTGNNPMCIFLRWKEQTKQRTRKSSTILCMNSPRTIPMVWQLWSCWKPGFQDLNCWA